MKEHKIIAMLAQEVEVNDPIDWGMLQVDEKQAYELIASQVLEQFGDTTDRLTILSTITKLVVENFVLNLKLMKREQDGN
jgi:hypothetical protein